MASVSKVTKALSSALRAAASRCQLLGDAFAIGRHGGIGDQFLHAADLAFDPRQPVQQIFFLFIAEGRAVHYFYGRIAQSLPPSC